MNVQSTDALFNLKRFFGASSIEAAPENGFDPARNVMAIRMPDTRKDKKIIYLLHANGTLRGLNLTDCGLENKQWSMLEESLDLSRLEALNLRSNNLTREPDLSCMPGLRYLDLGNNELSTFSLPQRMDQMEHIYLDGNPFEDRVLAARVNQGRRALLEYLRSLLSENVEELYEARLLIIGEPRSGKTSLRKKLQNVESELPTLSTQGIDVDIDVESNSFSHVDSLGRAITFRYQVWDFGGQRQYHPTHQLFFSKSTVYVLVTNTDYDHKTEGDVEFWLETVDKLGEGSPVLRFQNAPSDRTDSTNWSEINRRFGHMIKGVYTANLDRINPSNKNRFNKGDAKEFERLKTDIIHQLKHLELIGEKITPAWRSIRDTLAEVAKKKPYISLEHYCQICDAVKYSDPGRQLELSKTFHLLGIFLHYQHNPILRNTVILQNEWAIDAVFAILDSRILRDNFGRFTLSDLSQIWPEKKYDGKREDLLQLLQEFELCYPLPEKKGFVAPQCLPKTPPETESTWDQTDNVRVDITFDFLPRAVITRLIVKMHEHIALEKNWVWQGGAVFQGDLLNIKDSQAWVQENYKERRIFIQLRGVYSEDLFREIQSRLRDIQKEGFPNLVVDYLIYCNCADCKQSDKPTSFKYFEELLYYRRHLKRNDIECRNRGKKVGIDSILSGVISPNQQEEDQNRLPSTVNGHIILQSNVTLMQNDPSEQSNKSIYGVLTAFIVILPTIAFSVSQLTPLYALLTIVATIFILMLTLVFAGTQNKTLSQDVFVKISEKILTKVPGLDIFLQFIKRKGN